MSPTPHDADCQVCLRPATTHHEVIGGLCDLHATALDDAVREGTDPLDVVALWRAHMIAGALDYLDNHKPPEGEAP